MPTWEKTRFSTEPILPEFTQSSKIRHETENFLRVRGITHERCVDCVRRGMSGVGGGMFKVSDIGRRGGARLFGGIG
jgi:hypothetical protein